MNRNGYIVVLVAVLAWVVAAVIVGSPTLGVFDRGSAHAANSPACLPATLQRSARLPGTAVDVSPQPHSALANPATQISFRGIGVADITHLAVTGSRSGAHAGHLAAYVQHDGASFVPDRPFEPGEQVQVRAQIGARRVAYAFRVDTPYPTASVAAFPNPAAAPADVQSFYTLPGAQVPVMTVTRPDRDPAAGDILTTNGPGPGQYGPLIYTPRGQLVWFEQLHGGEAAENLNEQSWEGRRVLTWWRGSVLSLGFGVGEDVVMDAGYRTLATIAGGNGLKADLHDFQLAGDGVAYITAYNPIRCDLKAAGGLRDGAIVDTAIQQIDVRTGLVRWEWHSLDHVGAAESEVETPKDSTPWDYFHLNSIDPEPGGDLLISARSTWAGYQLDGHSGEVLWRLGGNRSSFKMGAGTTMAWQHDARMLADGEVTFFDDGSNPPIHAQSRGLRIVLDMRNHSARLAFAYTHRDPPLLAASQGNMQTLPGGNALVGYGGVPAISEFARDGSLLFDAHQPFDMSFYRAFRYPWHGRPASAPSVVASLNDTGEETVVHASWNGATDVASWRVLAGAASGGVAARTTIAAGGFEGSVTLPKTYMRVAVQALDATGRVLASSPTVGVFSYAAALKAAKA